MTQHTSDNYIVAYGYQDKFELTEREAQELVRAAEEGAKLVKFSNRAFSTNFTWILPKGETQQQDLNSQEMLLAEKISEWLSRPINELDWSDQQSLSYAIKLIKRVGYSETKYLWDRDANGAYPSVKKFIMNAKQIDSADEIESGESE